MISIFTKYSVIIISLVFLFLFAYILNLYFSNLYITQLNDYTKLMLNIYATHLTECSGFDDVSLTALSTCNLIPFFNVQNSNSSLYPYSFYDPWTHKNTRGFVGLEGDIDMLPVYAEAACKYNMSFDGYIYIDKPVNITYSSICIGDNCYDISCSLTPRNIAPGFYRAKIYYTNKVEVII